MSYIHVVVGLLHNSDGMSGWLFTIVQLVAHGFQHCFFTWLKTFCTYLTTGGFCSDPALEVAKDNMRPATREFREGFLGILPEAEVGSASCTRGGICLHNHWTTVPNNIPLGKLTVRCRFFSPFVDDEFPGETIWVFHIHLFVYPRVCAWNFGYLWYIKV